MIVALLEADMIEKVTEGTGEFLFEAFLVPKGPKGPHRPPKDGGRLFTIEILFL